MGIVSMYTERHKSSILFLRQNNLHFFKYKNKPNYLYMVSILFQGIIGRLKDKTTVEKNESRACIASAQRISDRSDEILKKMTETKAKLLQVTKQKDTTVNALKHEINRLTLENEKLTDRIRNKFGKLILNSFFIFHSSFFSIFN